MKVGNITVTRKSAVFTISRADALALLDDPDTIILPTGEQFRWSVGYRMIYKIKSADGTDSYWEAKFRRGTGDEPEQPWQDQGEVDCYQVQQVEKTVKVWERI